MKIYTKTGDKGKTTLLGGTRVSKYHPRIDAYGTVDELNSFIGLLRALGVEKQYDSVLEAVQNRLFDIGSLLAMEHQQHKFKLPDIKVSDIELLENEMDIMDATLPKLNSFIIPGGNQLTAMCHVCRSVCRRAERLITELSDNEQINEQIIIYVNRLSDYFFMLARKIAYDSNIEMPIWKNTAKS